MKNSMIFMVFRTPTGYQNVIKIFETGECAKIGESLESFWTTLLKNYLTENSLDFHRDIDWNNEQDFNFTKKTFTANGLYFNKSRLTVKTRYDDIYFYVAYYS